MKVKVETILVESDMEGKAILDLIPILNITKLILGASKATIRLLKYINTSDTIFDILAFELFSHGLL